jgi:predicted Fe-Mo cluster-binding NifX family protein
MRVAVPIWGEVVSPLFDSAGTLLVVRFGRDGEMDRQQLAIAGAAPAVRAQLLVRVGVEVLLCGAISRSVQRMLKASGITVVGWVTGPVDEVLEAFIADELDRPRFQLPGCCGRGQQRRRRARRGPGGRRNE